MRSPQVTSASASRSRRTRTTCSRFLSAARHSAVSPSESLASTSAPRSSSCPTQSIFSFQEAQISAVVPELSTVRISAPRSARSWMDLADPRWEAINRGVRPLLSRPSVVAPTMGNKSITSRDLFRAGDAMACSLCGPCPQCPLQRESILRRFYARRSGLQYAVLCGLPHYSRLLRHLNLKEASRRCAARLPLPYGAMYFQICDNDGRSSWDSLLARCVLALSSAPVERPNPTRCIRFRPRGSDSR